MHINIHIASQWLSRVWNKLWTIVMTYLISLCSCQGVYPVRVVKYAVSLSNIKVPGTVDGSYHVWWYFQRFHPWRRKPTGIEINMGRKTPLFKLALLWWWNFMRNRTFVTTAIRACYPAAQFWQSGVLIIQEDVATGLLYDISIDRSCLARNSVSQITMTLWHGNAFWWPVSNGENISTSQFSKYGAKLYKWA